MCCARYRISSLLFVFQALVLLFAAGNAVASGTADMRERSSLSEETVKKETMPSLTPAEAAVIINKGTERPGTGKYLYVKAAGTYVCRACGAPLYISRDKFDSDCGWPAFDDAVPGAVREDLDADGRRVEILCMNCGGHLGHVFRGERLTPKNVRHCVNSISLHFVPEGESLSGTSAEKKRASGTGEGEEQRPSEAATAVFGGGCFWGVEHIFAGTPGVLDAESGYSGGTDPDPTYEEVCTGETGHAEVVKVTYDPRRISYEELARLFFELHDPTQRDRQGFDVGSQYRSILFYNNEEEKRTAERLIALLQDNGYKVVTALSPASAFHPAEGYHQDYLVKHPERRCHLPVNRFERKAGL